MKSVKNIRNELPLHVVTIETREDFTNNQRCLYFDKVQPPQQEDSNDVEDEPDLEMLKQEIIKKELELDVISDANKVTAD